MSKVKEPRFRVGQKIKHTKPGCETATIVAIEPINDGVILKCRGDDDEKFDAVMRNAWFKGL